MLPLLLSVQRCLNIVQPRLVLRCLNLALHCRLWGELDVCSEGSIELRHETGHKGTTRDLIQDQAFTPDRGGSGGDDAPAEPLGHPSMTDQASLSRFFKPKSPSRPPIRPTPIVIDGSDSDDEDPASSSKRPLSPTAVAVAAADSRPGHARKRTKVTGDLTSWYFDAKATPSTSTSHHTPAEALSPSQKKFRHKFLGDASRSRSSGYLDKDSLYTPQAGSSGIKDPGAEVQKLRKAKVSYTPLEQQWLDLKEAHVSFLCNPGRSSDRC